MYVLVFSLLLFHTCMTDCKDIVVLYFAASDATSGPVNVRVNRSQLLSRTICWDSTWGLEEANVTCRQMGFLNASSTTVAVSNAASSSIIFNVRCSWTEKNLADCRYSLVGPCQSNKHVSVTCLKNPAFNDLFDVRLNGPAAHNGVVEVRAEFGDSRRPWYAQCYNLWSQEDSEVVCRQLGYSGVKATTRVSGSPPNAVDGELTCTRTEQTLRGCGVILTTACTNKTTYPKVECNLDSATQQSFDIRLTNGNNSAGTVEILKYGRWGVICDVNIQSARVACQQLGFVDVIRVTEPAEFGQGNGSIHLKNPGCKGDERSIEKCPIPLGWGGGINGCQTKDSAGVVCSREEFPSYDISSVLTANASKSFGRFFLHSPGFPQLFNYEDHTHLLCTMTSTTFVEFSLYIHYKRFQEAHTESLSFQANDTQPANSTFYLLQLYGDDSNPGPYTTNTTSLTMEFKSNGGAIGNGKVRVEIRVPKDTDVSLTCSKPAAQSTAPPPTTISSTSPTSQGNPTTTTVMVTTVTNSTTDTTPGSTKGVVIEQTTPPVSMATNQTNATAPAPQALDTSKIYIPIVASLVPLLLIIVVVIVVVVVVIPRCRRAKSPARMNAAPEPDPDDSGIFEMDHKLNKSKKKAKAGNVNPGFDDVDIKVPDLHREADLESAEMKPVFALDPPMNVYKMDTRSEKGKSVHEVAVVKAAYPSQTYAMVNKPRKKPKVEVGAGVDVHVYGVVNKPKCQKGNGAMKPDDLGHANDGFEDDPTDLGNFQGHGNYPAIPAKFDLHADIDDRIDEPGESEQFEDFRPEFATYAEVGSYGAPRLGLDVRAKDPVTPDSKPDKKKAKKRDKPDKKVKSKSNPFSKSKKSKGDKQKGAKDHVFSARPRDYDYIEAEFQQKDTPPSGRSRLCSPYADVELSSLSNYGGAGARPRTPVSPEESTEGDVYNRLNFPMLKKGASSFVQKPQNQTYDCVNYDKYPKVQSEDPYEDYGDRAADSRSVDSDNPYTEEVPVSNKDGADDNTYEEALPVVVKTNTITTWDDGPEEFL